MPIDLVNNTQTYTPQTQKNLYFWQFYKPLRQNSLSLCQRRHKKVLSFWELVLSFWELVLSFWELVLSFWELVLSFWELVLSFWELVLSFWELVLSFGVNSSGLIFDSSGLGFTRNGSGSESQLQSHLLLYHKGGCLGTVPMNLPR